jgi:hypothetical protein
MCLLCVKECESVRVRVSVCRHDVQDVGNRFSISSVAFPKLDQRGEKMMPMTLRLLRSTVYGLRSTVYGLRSTVYGVRCTVYGLRATEAGTFSLALLCCKTSLLRLDYRLLSAEQYYVIQVHHTSHRVAVLPLLSERRGFALINQGRS